MKFGTKKVINYIKILNFLLLICLIASTNMGGCHNTDGSTETVTRIIGPDGGEINSADGLLTLIIPPGALTVDTEIAVTRFKELEAGENLLLYELLPDGLQFQIPATIRVNVKDLTGFMEVADDFIFPNLPLIVSNEGDDFLALDMPTLDIDFDTGEAVLTANVDHFTGFVVGGKNGLEVSVNGVPFMTPANSPFGPVKVSVKNIGVLFDDPVNRLPILYDDTSQSPVLYRGPDPLLSLMPEPQKGQTQVYDINYSCGDPGLGKFVTEILFSLVELDLEFVYIPGELNIAAAFIFDVVSTFPGEDKRIEVTKLFSYTVRASRLVECTGMMPPGDDVMPPGDDVMPPGDDAPVEMCPIEGFYMTTSPGCDLNMFTLGKTLATGKLLITPLGPGNPGPSTFEGPDMDGKFESVNKDLIIFGQNGHTCILECVTGDENKVKVTCFNNQGGMCMETLELQTN